MPTPEEIETLDGTSARRMLAQLTALIATLYALIDELRETIAQQRHQLEQLQRAVFGTSAEKMPSVKRQLNKKRRREETADERRQKAAQAKCRQEARGGAGRSRRAPHRGLRLC